MLRGVPMLPFLSLTMPSVTGETETDRWHQLAEADYTICRAFADHYNARLQRTLSSHRVGWEKAGRIAYGILLPDPLLRAGSGGEWYLYYVWGEILLRRTEAERQERRMILLAESVEDWAHLLRQAVNPLVIDSRYEIIPDYTDALGETENVPNGFRFRLFAYAPEAVRPSDLSVSGWGETPQSAARDACRRWLEKQTPALDI